MTRVSGSEAVGVSQNMRGYKQRTGKDEGAGVHYQYSTQCRWETNRSGGHSSSLACVNGPEAVGVSKNMRIYKHRTGKEEGILTSITNTRRSGNTNGGHSSYLTLVIRYEEAYAYTG